MPDINEVDHRGIFFNGFAQFHEDERTSDVVILVEGSRFHVHRIVLAAQSTFFKNLLLEENFPQAKVTLKRSPAVPAETFRILLEYLYKGTLNLDKILIDRTVELIELSETLGLGDLRKCIIRYLENSVSCTNVQKVLDVAMKEGLKLLQERCLWIYCMSVEEIYERSLVLELPPELFLQIFCRLAEKVSAIKLFQVALEVLNRCKEGTDIYENVKHHIKNEIKYVKIHAENFIRVVGRSNIFSLSEFVSIAGEFYDRSLLDRAQDGSLYSRERDVTAMVKAQGNGLYELDRTMLINTIKFKLSPDHPSIDIQTSLDSMNWINLTEHYLGWCHFGVKHFCFPEIAARYLKFTPRFRGELSVDLVEVLCLANPVPQVNAYIWCRENIMKTESALVLCFNSVTGKYEPQTVISEVIERGMDPLPYMTQKLSYQSKENFFNVRFSQAYLLDSLRFYLWDLMGERYSYKVWLNFYAHEAEVICDKSDVLVSGWQKIIFSPRPVISIFIECFNVTIGEELKIAAIEVPSQV